MGPYMSPIPINASMGMLISLAVAFVITPWLALRFSGAHHAVVKDERDTKLAKFFRARLTPFLNREHGKPMRRKLWLGILAGLLFAVSLAVVKLVVLKMLPFDNKSEFQVIVDMPSGTALEQTAARAARDGRLSCHGAGSDRLRGLCGQRLADQLQRPGAPVLPARAGGAGRPAGQPEGQASAQPQQPRDRHQRAANRCKRSRKNGVPRSRSSKCRPARR